jgi:hypothetical protein
VRRRAAGLGQTWSGPSRCRGGQRQQSTWLEWVVVGTPPPEPPDRKRQDRPDVLHFTAELPARWARLQSSSRISVPS